VNGGRCGRPGPRANESKVGTPTRWPQRTAQSGLDQRTATFRPKFILTEGGATFVVGQAPPFVHKGQLAHLLDTIRNGFRNVSGSVVVCSRRARGHEGGKKKKKGGGGVKKTALQKQATFKRLRGAPRGRRGRTFRAFRREGIVMGTTVVTTGPWTVRRLETGPVRGALRAAA